MNSYTSDGITVGGGWVWEWEWDCFVPRWETGAVGQSSGEEGGGVCRYEGGEVVMMPGSGEGRFIGGEGRDSFEVGMPLYFVVRVRVRSNNGGEVVAEGRWEKMFSVVEGGDSGLVVRESQWMCDDGAVGYSVCVLLLFNCAIIVLLLIID